MRKILSSSILMAAIFCGANAVAAADAKMSGVKTKAPKTAKAGGSSFKQLNVYTESQDGGNRFAPSGWMGATRDLDLKDAHTDRPRSGKTCIKMSYSAKSVTDLWAGIYWQHPPNNWGNQAKVGLNLTGAKKLTFWARGEKGGETLAEVKVGGIKGNFPDSDEASLKDIVLTDTWAPYSIPLEGKDLSYIIGGFCVVFSKDSNPNGASIYLDDIVFTGQ